MLFFLSAFPAHSRVPVFLCLFLFPSSLHAIGKGRTHDTPFLSSSYWLSFATFVAKACNGCCKGVQRLLRGLMSVMVCVCLCAGWGVGDRRVLLLPVAGIKKAGSVPSFGSFPPVCGLCMAAVSGCRLLPFPSFRSCRWFLRCLALAAARRGACR